MTPRQGGALRGWLLLAVSALAIAGALALLLAASRTPVVQDWLPWPWQSFFRRALVTHVVFAFQVWYLAMLGGLAVAARVEGRTGGLGLALAVAGTILLVVPALANRGEPSLNNYVPVLVDPIFLAGLGLVAVGVAVPVLELLLRPRSDDPAFALGVATAGLIYLLALACTLLAWQDLPPGATVAGHAEEIFWGGGHLLQLTYVALLLSCWQALGADASGTAPLPRVAWRAVCALLVIAALPGPAFYLIHAGDLAAQRAAFTRLYWIGLPVPLLIAIIATALHSRRRSLDWRSPAQLGLVLSLGLFVLGGLFGGFADGTDTRTPAHYHAEIGGVNLAFMGLIFARLLPALGRTGKRGRAVRLQFWLYGAGQALFCLGMFVAGWEGVARKVAGADQDLDSALKVAGMGATGVGGFVAVAGGVLFIWLALRRLVGRPSEG